MKMNVSTWVLRKHMPMDQQPSVYSHITEQWHVKRSYDAIVANGSDAPLCERPHLWLDPIKLEILVSYCREARAGEHGLQWSVGSRLKGFEKDGNSLGETQPRTCWVICDSVPVCVAVDRLRPCTSAELLAFHYTQTKGSSPLTTDAQTQQGFIDERAPINPTAADSSQNVNESEDEDEQDDELSEPTQLTRTEKRKEIHMDERAKELRAMLFVTDSSLASSVRPSDETQEQLERSLKQARTAKNGVDTLQDVSYLFQKGHCDRQRHGFLQVRMAGMRKNNQKKVLQKKDG